MPFDPSKPFTKVDEPKNLGFDPSQPFEVVEDVKKKDQGETVDSGSVSGTPVAPSSKNGKEAFQKRNEEMLAQDRERARQLHADAANRAKVLPSDKIDPLGIIKGSMSDKTTQEVNAEISNLSKRREEERRKSDEEISHLPFAEKVKSHASSFAQGATGPLAATMKVINRAYRNAKEATTGEEDVLGRYADKQVSKEIDQIRNDLFPEHEKLKGTFGSQVARGLGQVSAMAATGYAGGGATIPSFGAFNETFDSEYNQAIEGGASEEDAVKVGLLNGAASAGLEVLPVMGALHRANKATGGTLFKRAIEAGKGAVKGAAEEAVTEAAQQAASNKIASETYDPERKLTEGVAESATVGGTTGIIFNLALSALGAKLRTAKTKEEISETENDINSLQEGEKQSKRAEILASLELDDNNQPIMTPEAKAKLDEIDNQTINPNTPNSGELKNEGQQVPVPEQVQQQGPDATGAEQVPPLAETQEPGNIGNGKQADQGINGTTEIQNGVLDQPTGEDIKTEEGNIPASKEQRPIEAVNNRDVEGIVGLASDPSQLVKERLDEDKPDIAKTPGEADNAQGGNEQGTPVADHNGADVRDNAEIQDRPSSTQVKESKFSIRSRLSEGPSEVLRKLAKKDPQYYEVLKNDKAAREADKYVSEDFDGAYDFVMSPDTKTRDLPKVVSTAGSLLRTLEENAKTAKGEAKTEIKKAIQDIRTKIREEITPTGQGVNLMKQVGDTLPLADRMIIMAESTANQKTDEALRNDDIEQKVKQEVAPVVAKTIEATVNDSAKVRELERRIAQLEDIIATKKTEKRREAIKKVVTKLDGLINSNNAYSDATGIVAVTKEGLRLIKATIIAGGKVADAIEKGVRYINAKTNGKPWDEARFRRDVEESIADQRATLDELYDKREAAKAARKELKSATRKGLETGDFSDLISLLESKEMAHDEIDRYVSSIKENHEDQIVMETSRRIEKNLGIKPKNDPRIESLARKIANGQPLTDAERVELTKKKYGIPEVTNDDKARILAISEEIERVSEDPDLKMEAIDNLRHELQKLYPRNKFESFLNWFDSVVWYPNMLSGLSTSALNIKDALFNTLSIGYLFRKGGYQAFIDQFRGLAKGSDRALIGIRQGFLNSGTMYNLDAPDKYDIRRKTAEDFAREGSKVAKYWSRWVGRAMATPNILNNANKYSALSFMIQKDLRQNGVPEKDIIKIKNEILFGKKELIQSFIPKAVSLVYGDSPRDLSDKVKEAKVRRTVENMVLDSINDQVASSEGRSALEIASEIAERATYQNKSTGIAGLLSKHIQKVLSQDITLGGQQIPTGSLIKKITGVDFVNTTFNVINSSLNHTPYGYFRANEKSFSRMVDYLLSKAKINAAIQDAVGYSEARSNEERARLLQKANTATALWTVLSILAIKGALDDEEDGMQITGSVSPDQPLNDNSKFVHRKEAYAVRPPYSIKLPGIGWTSYLGTGYAPIMSQIGNASDYLRAEKANGTTVEDLIKAGLFGGLGSAKSTIWDNTPLRHITDRPELQKNIDTGNFSDGLANFFIANAESAAGSVVPNLVKQTGKMLDPTVYTPKDMAGRIMKATSILNYAAIFGGEGLKRGYVVDLLGRRVSNRPGEKYFNMVMQPPSPEDQKYYDLLYSTFGTPSNYPSLISPQMKVYIPVEKQEDIDRKMEANQKLFEDGTITELELENRNNEIGSESKKLDDLGNDPLLYSRASEYRGEFFREELDAMDLDGKTTEERRELIKKALKRAGKKAVRRLQQDISNETETP